MKKQPSIGELLSNAVLFARNHGKRQSSKERFARDKWFVKLDNDVTVTYDGHPDSCDDGDTECFVVSIAAGGDRMTFFVDLDGCSDDNPTADIAYTDERFEDDLTDQAESVGLSPASARKTVISAINKLKLTP
jgi:hypothetical protein